jgi:hypothetical protein
MLYFQLNSLVTLSKEKVEKYYDRHVYNHDWVLSAERKHDIIVTTVIIMVVCILLVGLLTTLVDEMLFGKLTLLGYILYINLFGISLMILKIIRDSIIHTYLINSILILMEQKTELSQIYRYLQEEWGINLDV